MSDVDLLRRASEVSAIKLPDDWRNPTYSQPNCPTCGRFAYRRSDGAWAFKCVTWDWYMGAWEHE